MKNFTLVLKALSPLFLLVGMLHLVLGVGAEVMLGANLDEAALSDAVLDSQNRFYGVSFMLYGVLFYLCATDIEKYKPVLVSLLVVFFLAGLARVVSIATHGVPSALVLALLGSEVLLPPVLFIWLRKLGISA